MSVNLDAVLANAGADGTLLIVIAGFCRRFIVAWIRKVAGTSDLENVGKELVAEMRAIGLEVKNHSTELAYMRGLEEGKRQAK